MTICPEDFSLTRGKKEELVGGTASENAEITKGILTGKLRGTKRNAVLMNAGLALYAAKAVPTMQEGVAKAAEMIDSGKAYEKLEEYVKVSNQ
ncbi:anthranilate phosphoribosyltransferase [Bacteroides xylanisolvens]|nr:anthranilate phosphoribosyltransferase [Bacteroides xylanisolvens]